MSRSDGWMPLYVGAYLTDTMRLNGPQHGAYLLLLMHYWCNGPLEDDDASLAAIARTEMKSWRRDIGPVIRRFFEARDGLLFQKRMELERAKATDISDKRRAAAYASHKVNGTEAPPGANAPANAPANGRANAGQMHGACASKPSASRADIRAGHLQNRTEEGSEATLRAAAGAAAPSPATPRDQLWSEGLSLLRGLTGQSDRAARSSMGKLVRDAKDDCAKVFNALWDAGDVRPIDPMPWLIAAVKPPKPGYNPFLDPAFDDEKPSLINQLAIDHVH